ncbi:MAG: helix-turn-helix transcriptional regulator [Acidobacteriaceae bacterium]|nr:helix-turn-helix transcriptional regulator [Acidobacteriaceae bacterium]
METESGKSHVDAKASRIDLANTQIDPATAEMFIAERKIGERIKKLRLKKSMGLVELGRHTGLSASFLSQLETGRVVPTLRNLARIAMVFSKDLSYFFEPEPHTLFRIHRKHERVRLPQTGVDDPTYYFESLGYMVPDRHLDPYYAEFIPLKANTDVRPHVHPGYEFLFMLEGELELRHGDKTHTVQVGDSVYFDASTPHSYRCAGKTSAVALIVTMHQQHLPQPAMNLRPLGAPLGARIPSGSQSAAPGAMPPVEQTGIAKPRPSAAPAPLRRN